MYRGASRDGWPFPSTIPSSRLRPGEIVVDLFAGGGGASVALEQALGRPVDIAINHNPWAVGLHAANHPFTRHMVEDVWEANPHAECAGRRVGWLHASPDCTHFSQAKGGQPRDRATRSLSWVVVRWAGAVRPRIISLENVREILKWGPLVAKRDKATGRVVTLDEIEVIDPESGEAYTVNRVADPGERVPVRNQFLVPDKRHEGRTWRHFVAALQALGYHVEWKRLKACDFGAGTSRERLFVVARRDGEPIRWPAPTHGPGRPLPYVSAADCIDWSVPCPSIFTRAKPLADATLRRIARGVKRYVLDAAEPFIVQCANASANGIAGSSAPLGTVTAKPKGGSHAVVAPTLVQTGYGERAGQAPRALDIAQPLGTIVAGAAKHAVAAASLVKFRGASDGASVAEPMPTITSGAGAARPAGAAHAMGVFAAFFEQANGGFAADGAGHDAREPMSTITGTGSQQRLVAAHLATLRGDNVGAGATDPLRTLSAGGEHHAVVECTLSPEQEAGALRVAAFLMRYYGQGGQWGELDSPLATVTTKDRLALVTVMVRGTPHVIVDIGLRMLQRHELFRAQGFPASYVIDRTADGRVLPVWRSVAMVGNSVSPPPLRAIAEANLDAVFATAEVA